MMDLLGDIASKPRRAFSTHERTEQREEWLTPKYIIDALGQFDLDPCSPTEDRRPWPTAAKHLTVFDNGLTTPWAGRVWLNPPYGRETIKFVAKLADHGNGIAFVFARTETRMFQEHVFGKAAGILFCRGRIHFCDYKGKPADNSSGAPSVLIAYGRENLEALRSSGIDGHVISLWGGA